MIITVTKYVFPQCAIPLCTNNRWVCILFVLLFSSCTTRTGDFSLSAPPSTKLFLNAITLPDSLSKAGSVRLYWSGESQNSYLKGFEIATDSNDCSTDRAYRDALIWNFTTRTDSAFLFPIKKGLQFGKISFYARAIDNNNTQDPNPPCIRLPIKNSFPELKLDKLIDGKPTTDTVHLVFTLSWTIDDADGDANMDSVYIKVNNGGSWIGFSKSISRLTFVPNQPEAIETTTAKLLGGLDGNNLNINSGALRLSGRDTIFLRVKDISDAYSQPDTALFYYKGKKSDFLYLDAYQGTAERAVYDPILAAAFEGQYDVFDMNRNGNAYFPLNWNLTFTQYLKLYKRVLWVTDNANPGGLSIERGAAAIQSLLNGGGKILICATKLPENLESPVFQYLPIDSLSKNVGQARLQNNSNILPLNGFGDTLRTTQLFTNVSTMYVPVSNQLYKAANIQKLSGWQGPETIAAVGKNNNGKINRVVFGIDLHKLNGRPESLNSFVKNILVDEFGE